MVRLYEAKDYDEMCSWYIGHSLPVPNPIFLPPVGYIEDGLAAGFLVCCDNNFAIAEFFITNKKAPVEDRKKALRNVADKLVEHAKFLKIKIIKVDTQLDVLREFAAEYKFKSLGDYSMFIKEI